MTTATSTLLLCGLFCCGLHTSEGLGNLDGSPTMVTIKDSGNSDGVLTGALEGSTVIDLGNLNGAPTQLVPVNGPKIPAVGGFLQIKDLVQGLLKTSRGIYTLMISIWNGLKNIAYKKFLLAVANGLESSDDKRANKLCDLIRELVLVGVFNPAIFLRTVIDQWWPNGAGLVRYGIRGQGNSAVQPIKQAIYLVQSLLKSFRGINILITCIWNGLYNGFVTDVFYGVVNGLQLSGDKLAIQLSVLIRACLLPDGFNGALFFAIPQDQCCQRGVNNKQVLGQNNNRTKVTDIKNGGGAQQRRPCKRGGTDGSSAPSEWNQQEWGWNQRSGAVASSQTGGGYQNEGRANGYYYDGGQRYGNGGPSPQYSGGESVAYASSRANGRR